MIQATQIGGAWEDLQSIVSKAPEYLSKATTIVKKAGPYLDVVESVVSDPAFPLVVERVKTIRSLEAKQAAEKPATPKVQAAWAAIPSTPPPVATAATPGVGLSKLVKPLDAYIYSRRHPVVAYAVGIGAVLVVVGLGFGAGYGIARLRK